jgi:hypothetical protein
MRSHLIHRLLLSLVLAFGFSSIACDDDDPSPVAPREPTSAPTATPTAVPTVMPTPTPSGPAVGDRVGFFGKIREIRAFRMTISDVEEVATNADTVFIRNGQPAAFADFSVGENVRVAGVVLGDGAILATKITLLPAS